LKANNIFYNKKFVLTRLPGAMWILSTPPRIAAASLDRKGFHDLYSTFWIGLADPSGAGTSTWTLD